MGLDWRLLSNNALLSFLYLSLVSQLLAFFVWYKGLALGGIARVSQIQLLQPFITLFASLLLLREPTNTQTIVFATLVVGIVWLGKRLPISDRPDKPARPATIKTRPL